MGGNNISDSFSYNLRDRDVVQRAEKIAKSMDISFSAYVMRCLIASDPVRGKELRESQKKEAGQVVPSQGPTTEENEKDKYKPDIDSIDVIQFSRYINSIDDVSMLKRVQKNGHVIDTVAKTKLKRLVYS